MTVSISSLKRYALHIQNIQPVKNFDKKTQGYNVFERHYNPVDSLLPKELDILVNEMPELATNKYPTCCGGDEVEGDYDGEIDYTNDSTALGSKYYQTIIHNLHSMIAEYTISIMV